VGIIIGVIASQYIGVDSMVWLIVGFALLTGIAGRNVAAIPFVVMAGVLIGLWRGSIDQMRMDDFRAVYGTIATVEGVISEDPVQDSTGRIKLSVQASALNGRLVTGSIWVGIASGEQLRRNDIVRVQGSMQDGFGGYAASMGFAHLLESRRAQPSDPMTQLRDWFAGMVRRVVPDPEASLGLGYVIGQRSMLPPDLDIALKIAGLTHIVVASGYNLTILVRLSRRLLMRISKFTAAAGATGLIIGFIGITGASPSMTRAGLVSGLSLLAWYYGRSFHPLILLPFVAALTLLINPAFGWGDLGWQLSFLAFGGVMIVAPLMQRYFFGDKKPGTIRQIAGETIAAQVVTLPVIVVAFGQFSNVAVIANLMILPLVPLAMLLTFIAGVSAWVLPAVVAESIAMLATALLRYMIEVANYFAALPWAQTTIQASGWMAAAYFAILIIICLYAWRKTGYNLRESNLVE
jgi:competence protein ComEC